MSVQVGQVLDKYELLERVGQGGMAVVYRGVDRTLKRTVAVKILHKHLADYQEARDRFEREAQAVAKLRHENILEIFDYAAGDESYIVTEFIDGQTLKQFVTDRPIAFPEVGAMIILQVCRALAHAHAVGILHRDIKPENIMVRSDGVVKLMDFGISHMVDLERLTVTGQLLGSPAYMAPEHVEGRPIDFRTDVFAVGIVLYQLTVNKLPFEGKNPHEVLKRIAECKFVDPRQANARIGNRLGRIILRAMAPTPAGRFGSIGEMVLAIESYLEESGLAKDKLPGELARYFAAPGAYEQALKVRLVDTLTRRGQELLDADDRSGALDCFDRVLTIDPDNERVLDVLDSLNRRARMKQGALVGACVTGLAVGAYAMWRQSEPPELDASDPVARNDPSRHDRRDVVAHEPKVKQPPIGDDAGVAVVERHDDARTAVVIVPPPPRDRDAGPIAPKTIITHVTVSPIPDSEYSTDGERTWLPVPASGVIELTLAERTVVDVRNRSSAFAQGGKQIEPGHDDAVSLSYLPARVVPRCKDHKVTSVEVAGEPARLDGASTVLIGRDATSRERRVQVVFHGDEVKNEPIAVVAEAGTTKEVECIAR
jgi:serine/threonine-protein kinase